MWPKKSELLKIALNNIKARVMIYILSSIAPSTLHLFIAILAEKFGVNHIFKDYIIMHTVTLNVQQH